MHLAVGPVHCSEKARRPFWSNRCGWTRNVACSAGRNATPLLLMLLVSLSVLLMQGLGMLTFFFLFLFPFSLQAVGSIRLYLAKTTYPNCFVWGVGDGRCIIVWMWWENVTLVQCWPHHASGFVRRLASFTLPFSTQLSGLRC